MALEPILTRGLRLGLWYIVFVHICLGCFLAYQVLASGIADAEPPFSRDDKAYLSENFPGGTLIDAHTYKWCAGQEWLFINSRGDRFTTGGACVRFH